MAFNATSSQHYTVATTTLPPASAGQVAFMRSNWALQSVCDFDTTYQAPFALSCPSGAWPGTETGYVLVKPKHTGSLNLSAYWSKDLTQAVSIPTAALNVATNLSGQRQRLSLSATAGDRLNFYQLGAAAYANLELTGPAGVSQLFSGADVSYVVADTGVHTAVIVPLGAQQLPAGTQLAVSKDSIVPLTVGSSTPISTGVPDSICD
ncbi:MAG: hypothetical protein HC933_18740 [Pleurocapsa sp. SU_196_0]|nr:hypothetical protein [Pleurocapsa sp. SU_196_0]